ncbi:MAG: hypothetical protein JNJ58_09600 [Chitinophagaceae bacterium]|nr:hypothetical protein [Chitinophagaceae bacterium]
MNKPYRSGFLERFGIFYLRLFRRRTGGIDQIPDDATLEREIRRITVRGIWMSGITGLIMVFPMIKADVIYADAKWYFHYGIVAAVTLLFTLIEFYCLFLISLRTVHEIADKLNIHSPKNDYLFQGPFSILNILSRTALEIQEPEVHLFGINPFRQVSKRNLLILGFIYKLKIILTNFILKYVLLLLVGKEILGVSVLYEALLVEFFWNAMVLYKVAKEARLRLFGFILANQMTAKLRTGGIQAQLSAQAKITTLRAIGNTVVLTRNYHPNMVILLLEFEEIFEIREPDRLDDWRLFLQDLQLLNLPERFFVLDTLCVSAAFDGKISDLEQHDLQQAFGEYNSIYSERMFALRKHLTHGRLHAAYSLCTLDFEKG